MGDEFGKTIRKTHSTRLRFKDGRSSRSYSGSRHRSRSPRSRRRSQGLAASSADSRYLYGDCQESLDADDEEFYGSGAAHQMEASLALQPESDNFTERLFDAMADDEGKDYWQQVYGQSIHDFPIQKEMSDDEYAAFVRRGMWQRKHAHDAEAKKYRDDESEKQRLKHADFVAQQQHLEQERKNARMKVVLESRWKVYLQMWTDLGTITWTMDTIPWPNSSGQEGDLSRSSIEQFLGFAADPKVLAREELRRRWHPDRWQQRAQRHVSEKDRAASLVAVTSVAQILNEIIGS